MNKGRHFWRRTLGHLVRGLVVMLPILGTVAITVWLWGLFESILGGPLKLLLPTPGPETTGPMRWVRYYPGMGSVLALVLILTVGMFLNTWIVRNLVNWMEDVFDRIPLVKSIYGSFRDLIDFFSSKQGKKASQVVLVTWPGGMIRCVGLLTRDELNDLPFGDAGNGRVAVYIPMSYALGGYTILVPREMVQPINMKMEDAMRFAITAGMSIDPNHKTQTDPEKTAAKT